MVRSAVVRLALVSLLAGVTVACGSDPGTTTDPARSLSTVASTLPTTAPSTTVTTTGAPTTTDAATTTGAPTTTSAPVPTGAPTTTSAAVPTGLASWPAPALATTAVADLPRLLPSAPMPAADEVVRFEQATNEDPMDHVQVFVTDQGSRLLQVTTNIFQVNATPLEQREPVTVAPWDVAWLTRSAPGFANLTLGGAGGHVHVNGWNMSREEILAAARSMTRRGDDRPGWDFATLPPGMTQLHEGWVGGYVSRELDWMVDDDLVAELVIWGGVPGGITSGAPTLGTFATVDVAGHRAVASERSVLDGPATSLISWSPDTDIVVYLGVEAPLDEALDIARSLSTVDAQTWASASRPAEPMFDGCRSFLC